MKTAAILSAAAVAGAEAVNHGWVMGDAKDQTTNCVVVAGSIELGATSTKCCETWKTMWDYYLTEDPTTHANKGTYGAGIKNPGHMAFVEAVRHAVANAGTCGETPFTTAMGNTNATLAENWAGMVARADTVATATVACTLKAGMMAVPSTSRECCHYKTALIANSANNGGGLAGSAGSWFTPDIDCVATECEADRKSPYVDAYFTAADWVQDTANTGVNQTCNEATWNGALTGALASVAPGLIKDVNFVADVAIVRERRSNTTDCSIVSGALELGTQRNDFCRAWRIILTWYYTAPTSPYIGFGLAGQFDTTSANCDVSSNIAGLVHAECETGGIIPTSESFQNAIREMCDPDNYATHVQQYGPALNANNGSMNVALRSGVSSVNLMCSRAQDMYDAMWFTTTTTTTVAPHFHTSYNTHTGFVMGDSKDTTTNC